MSGFGYYDNQQYLKKAKPMGNDYHHADIVVKGRVMATLYGLDAEALKARAYTYASAMNWHRAAVTIRHGEV